jgi:hypothetical protein
MQKLSTGATDWACGSAEASRAKTKRGRFSDDMEWSAWRRFPDPRKLELLTAPFGPGCYELRDGEQLVVFGMGGR